MGWWCNGSMPVSKTVDLGSNPSLPAQKKFLFLRTKVLHELSFAFKIVHKKIVNLIFWKIFDIIYIENEREVRV